MRRLCLLGFGVGDRRRAGLLSVLWTRWGMRGQEGLHRGHTSWYSVTVIFEMMLKVSVILGRCGLWL
jgi:hypothetical protein